MNDQLNLSRLLVSNGTFCFTSGIIFTLAAEPLAGFLNTLPIVMTGLGVGLILYGAFITFMATRPVITRRFTLFTILADSAWVLLNILLLVLPVFTFTAEAKWAIGITAICVDAFATLQFLVWRKMN
ncbi:MAG: hypothetical protein J0M11_10880 [Anaerolineae bacterium]|nr:hypothetical protein [Anaerolineae bacterium]